MLLKHYFNAVVAVIPRIFVSMVGVVISAAVASADVLPINYQGFTVWVDCARRGPAHFHYTAHRDAGRLPRNASYERDPSVPEQCQSISNQPFGKKRGVAYDVGHQVPANHFDGSAIAIHQTNYWTNLLPQTASMNRGAWLQTEYIIECIRDEVPVEVWGGAIWAKNQRLNQFVRSHGVQTPSAFWKVAIRTDNREAMAWVIPNGKAPVKSLNRWLKSVSHVENLTGIVFNAANKATKPRQSWKRPSGCSVQ